MGRLGLREVAAAVAFLVRGAASEEAGQCEDEDDGRG
jgi:hypothetical protein